MKETAKPAAPAGRSRAVRPLLSALCALALFAARRPATGPLATVTGPAKVTAAERKFLGTWTSTNTRGPGVGTVILKADGRYVAVCRRRTAAVCDAEGEWSLREGALVWTDDKNASAEDVNPVVEFSPDRFVLKEMSGALTIFTRAP